MQMFDLRWKTCFISDENLVVFHLVFHWVSRFIHLTEMEVIYWLLTAWIINEFENVTESREYALSDSVFTAFGTKKLINLILIWNIFGVCGI